ncbi:MAG TPA: hypothetical protein VGN07_21885 [Steroidobacteraceae bacterium]|jgi:hypothetical protein
MDDAKAQALIAALANGVNPLTGEVFPADSPYQAPDLIRALYAAGRALEAKSRTRPRIGQPNAGKQWSEEEERSLLAEFDRGRALAELSQIHGRSLIGIQARLEKHGRLQPADGAAPRQSFRFSGSNRALGARSGTS